MLVICASMKPAPGQAKNSAVRALCAQLSVVLREAVPSVGLMDLREKPLPLFDGRDPLEHDDPLVVEWLGAIADASALVFGLPAYWGLLSGAAKNFFDVLAGPAYDVDVESTVFFRKPCAAFVIGADDRSAEYGALGATELLTCLGMNLAGPVLALGNPRQAGGTLEHFFASILSSSGSAVLEGFRVRS